MADTSKSGLSGSPNVEEAPQKEEPKNLGERWKVIRDSVQGTFAAMPRVFRLVWDASPRATLTLAGVTVVAGIIPALTAYMGKLLINAVLNAIVTRARGLPDHTRLNLPLGLHSPFMTSIGIVVTLALVSLLIAEIGRASCRERV